MDNATIELIRTLVETPGPSGFEDRVREFVRAEIEPYADEVRVDAMGNLIARKRGAEGAPVVMVAAHLDEIGVMVTHVTKEGFVKFTNIGFVYPHALQGSRVMFTNGTRGVVYSERIKEMGKVYGLDKHYIDVGASSKEDCPVSVGDPAAFDRPMQIQGSRLVSKSMDDRIGCAVAIEAFKRLESSPNDVFVVFSSQEEVGTRGAQTAANAIGPDVGIAVDVTTTGDTPESAVMSVSLGSGAAIKVRDGGMIAHQGVVKLMRRHAEEGGIKHQMEVLSGGTTDARAIQVSGPGCAAGAISIPCRYVHSPSEMVDMGDVESSIALLHRILANTIEL